MLIQQLNKVALVPAITLVFSAFVGCGPSYIDTVKVEGTVTLNGKPVDGAKVMYSPLDEGGAPAYGLSDASGKYVVQTMQGRIGEGTTPGNYKVTVSKSIDVPTGKMRPTPEGREEPIVEGKDLLPIKYKFVANSPLNKTVEPGKTNVIDLELK